jgi:hypothetical protein
MASHTGNDAPTIALRALGWILGDPPRASRFLGITGLEPENLRERINDPALHAAVVAFLAGHEADLIDCARDLELPPEAIQRAARELGA